MQVEKPRGRYKNYCPDWETFVRAGLEMAEREPARTRLVVKYRERGNLCVVKVTDGTRIALKKTRLEEDFEQVENACVVVSKVLSRVHDWSDKQQPRDDKEDKKKKGKKRRKGK